MLRVREEGSHGDGDTREGRSKSGSKGRGAGRGAAGPARPAGCCQPLRCFSEGHSHRGVDGGEQNASKNKGGAEPRFCLCRRAEDGAWR